ncbi:hypothetical protein BDV36DRAFT_254961 [Aspergillus pseudocaelatus]|uniref:Secreted protein n=1 Tax=Aspergillus pseudocaelatus TaxID=1825620 RepID=A0ABQ6WLV7_9EURO|nr:hypothetical protein BDV36DRAFT_254961 [Aspergillus pseudocaelatus]
MLELASPLWSISCLVWISPGFGRSYSPCFRLKTVFACARHATDLSIESRTMWLSFGAPPRGCITQHTFPSWAKQESTSSRRAPRTPHQSFSDGKVVTSQTRMAVMQLCTYLSPHSMLC